MKFSIDITDENQLALIEQLRGKKTAKEFVSACALAGLSMADAQRKRMKEVEAKGQLLRFSATKPEFKTLDVAAITAALKDQDPQHPVKLEVGRLVQDYSNQLRQHAEKHGNKLPNKMKIGAQAAIEKVAFQITANAINQAIKGAADKKAAASK